ncbi:MAG: hypothetical protein A2075_12035 [Geobacteraceae bacterium GWC2_58_44]|nr:MAG: hypothetical protein A2075_12035 [Geobacteraceae bacterium GWC2_58_44]HBG06292.1 hypothetical protein [Geobacter sp.]
MTERFATQDALRSHIRSLTEVGSDLSQKQVARESGVNDGALNSWLQGKYKGNNENIFEKLRTWVEYRERSQTAADIMPPPPAFVKTPTAGRILPVLSYAQMAADFCVIYGGAGVGKTTTAKNYRDNNPNVWLATMTPDCSTVPAVLEEIAIAFGISNEKGGAASKIRREIVSRMKNSHGLLIVDEGQHLNSSGIESIRSLYDLADGDAGVVLAGNESVYNRITGGSRAAHFAQVFSRIGKRLRLNQSVDGDAHMLAAAFGITGKAEQALLADIAKKPGALRGMVKVIRNASMFAAGAGGAIGPAVIRAAWRDLGGEG